MLTAANIHVRKGNRDILTDVSLTLQPGEVLALAGPNGAGKSTLLKIMSGSDTAHKGTVSLNDQLLAEFPARELAQYRAVLSQKIVPGFDFTVREVVMMGRYPHFDGKPRPADEEAVEQAMESTGVTNFAQRSINSLSGGEQQRVHLARVLAQIWKAPNACLLLDEPANNLDLRHQHELLQLVSSLTDNGLAVLVVIHDINLAAQYASRVALLRKGKLVACDTPENVLTPNLLTKVFDMPMQHFRDAATGAEWFGPAAAADAHSLTKKAIANALT